MAKRSKRTKPRKPPVRAVRVNRPNRTVTGVGHFPKCVFGPVNSSGEGLGVPDGNPDPSVVVEHRQTVVLTPNSNGEIAFALVSSPYGAIALKSGKVTHTVNALTDEASATPNHYQSYTSKAFDTDAAFYAPGSITGCYDSVGVDYTILPFTESLRSGGPVYNAMEGGFHATNYRVVTTVGSVYFTGASLTDGGSAATARVDHHFDGDDILQGLAGNSTGAIGLADEFIARGVYLRQTPPKTFGDVSSLPGSRVFSARQPTSIMCPPNNFDYQPMKSIWAPYTIDSTSSSIVFHFAGACQASHIGATDSTPQSFEPIPGMGHAAVTYYSATGLSSTSSLTVSVRTCVEYQLAFDSPSSRFARLPAPLQQTGINVVKAMSRQAPSSVPMTPAIENAGWLSVLGKGASWYARAMRSAIGTSWQVGSWLAKEAGLNQVSSITGRGAKLMLTN